MSFQGIYRCAKYAFGPNRLHYCGPDKAGEISAYIEEHEADAGLKILLSQFKTMHPYLCEIAHANKIKDPYDEKVVEAYWLGNNLLNNISKQQVQNHLIDNLKIKKQSSFKSFESLNNKIGQGATLHHSFHVFNIWKRTGHLEEYHTMESMDACRISWGKILKISGPFITVETEPIVYKNRKLILDTPTTKKITRGLNADIDIDELKINDFISMHWNIPCEVITPEQVNNLRYFTNFHLSLANQTL